MPANSDLYRILSQHFLDLPHSRAIGLRYEGIRARRPVLSFDWQPHLVGRHDTQTIHGGTITTLVDMVSACAVTAQLPSAEILSTLDMRIDYMHPATPAAVSTAAPNATAWPAKWPSCAAAATKKTLPTPLPWAWPPSCAPRSPQNNKPD